MDTTIINNIFEDEIFELLQSSILQYSKNESICKLNDSPQIYFGSDEYNNDIRNDILEYTIQKCIKHAFNFSMCSFELIKTRKCPEHTDYNDYKNNVIIPIQCNHGAILKIENECYPIHENSAIIFDPVSKSHAVTGKISNKNQIFLSIYEIPEKELTDLIYANL